MRHRAGLLTLFCGLAIVHTWPLAGNLAGLSRLDNDDTNLNVFVISWIAHIVPRNPLALFDASIFYPERYTLAYSEHMLVPSLMGAPFIWVGVSPVTVYNILVLAGFALSGWTMALVVRRWTGSTLAGITAGMLYAFNAHLLTRLPHLQALHMEFLPVALLGFDQVLRAPRREWRTGSHEVAVGSRDSGVGRRETEVGSRRAETAYGAFSDVSAPSVSSAPSVAFPSSAASGSSVAPPSSAASVARSAALLASAFILQALCSNYTLVFLSGALVIAAVVRGDEWLASGRRDRLVALLCAGAIAVGLLSPFLWPYYVVSREQGMTRSIQEVALYSASWSDYLATGGRLHYAWWSHRWFEGRTSLFPGLIGLALAGAALCSTELWRDRRIRMAAAIGLVGLALSFGPALPGYAWLHRHIPLFEGMRAAARWGILLLTAVAILAGFAVGVLERRARGWTYWPAAAIALLALITLETLRAPLAFAGVPRIPPLYDNLQKATGAVVVEVPLFSGLSVSENARYMLNSTRHFRPLVNGYSGFETAAFRQRAERWRRFPAADVLADMTSLGVTHVVVHVRDCPPAQVDAAAVSPGLESLLDDGERRLYRLR
jgi:hypothetical protein